MKHKRDKVERPQEDSGAGRIHTDIERTEGRATEHQDTFRDISTIDQQEGNMSNGELGGNLGSIDREKETRKNR